MPLFCLVPDRASQGHPDWAASTHRGPCYVSAPDERRARIHAANAFFDAAAPRNEAGLMPASPYTSRTLVVADRTIDWSHDALRLGAILVPADPHATPGDHRDLRLLVR